MNTNIATRLAIAAKRAGMEHRSDWIEDYESSIYGSWKAVVEDYTGSAFEDRELLITMDEATLYITNNATEEEVTMFCTEENFGAILLMLKTWEHERNG